MLNRKKLRNALEAQTYNHKSGFLKWIEKEVIQTNCDLSDNYCRFYINSNYQIRGNNIILEILCVPTQGVFNEIEFRPKIFINSANFVERPKIYNDRRIFHPNINAYTCEIISKDLALEWNPTKEQHPFYKRFSALLRHLKYLIIQPNCNFVPNNTYNRRAAWNFHFNRGNYRSLLQQYCPLYLQNIISGELTSQLSKIEVQPSSNIDSLEQSDFWNIDSILTQNKIVSIDKSFEYNTSQEQNFDFLAKKIKRIDFHQGQPHIHGQQKIQE